MVVCFNMDYHKSSVVMRAITLTFGNRRAYKTAIPRNCEPSPRRRQQAAKQRKAA